MFLLVINTYLLGAPFMIHVLGIYYTPGSLKAKLCVEGSRLAYEYFAKNDIPYKRCGKLIVAVKPDEINSLKELYERGLKNNVQGLKLIDGQQIKSYEPHCQVRSDSTLTAFFFY